MTLRIDVYALGDLTGHCYVHFAFVFTLIVLLIVLNNFFKYYTDLCECILRCRYASNLEVARLAGTKKSLMAGIGLGIMFLVIFCIYGLAFWYGAKLIWDDGYSVGRMTIVSVDLSNVISSMYSFTASR